MGWVMEMDHKKELPKRKHPRLDHDDDSTWGAYCVTICTQFLACGKGDAFFCKNGLTTSSRFDTIISGHHALQAEAGR
jgi:hypothetical protein